jgi:sugar-specific transcriptional regulator TrmB
MNLEKTLFEYGLKEGHAKVYLAALELGSASIQKISQKAMLPRSTTENILESLHEKGLLSTFRKRRIRFFSAEDPHKIIQLAKSRASLLEQALPEFMALYGEAKVRPTVRYYQGKQAMKQILEEALDEAKEILFFSSSDDLFNTLIEDFPEFVKKRAAKKIPAKVILRDSAKARERQRLGPQELREVKIIPSSYNYHGMIMIWKNKISMFSFNKDLSAVVTESEELAETQRALFYLGWNTI